VEKLNLTGKSKHAADDSLKGLSALFVDGERVFIDNGAIHAKSDLERGLTFVKTPDELVNPRVVWVFWVTLKRFEGVQGYHGLVSYRILIDDEQKLGYKSLAEQVNKMDKAVRGTVDISAVPVTVTVRVRDFLQRIRPDLWEHAAQAFQASLA